mgnify:FL=1
MEHLAWWAGKLAATGADPFNWFMMAFCFGIGIGRHAVVYALMLAVGFSVLEYGALQLSPFVFAYHMAFRFLFAFVAWHAGTFIARKQDA